MFVFRKTVNFFNFHVTDVFELVMLGVFIFSLGMCVDAYLNMK